MDGAETAYQAGPFSGHFCEPLVRVDKDLNLLPARRALGLSRPTGSHGRSTCTRA